jgi:predicted RNA-binding Zn-ribbon protein involved in translation (DUF1610 family)
MKFPCTYDFHQMRVALESAGFSTTNSKRKKHKNKTFTCQKCGTKMKQQEESNVVTCPNCDNYIIFSEKKK